MLQSPPNGFTRGSRPQILGADGLPYRKDFGDYSLPHVLGFSAILGSAYKTYYHQAFDEAYRHDPQDALAMRQDAFLMGLLQERKLAVASLPWHLEVPDEQDKRQIQVRDILTKALKGVWGLRRFFWEMLDAIWYGRMGESCEWEWQQIDGARVLNLARFTPINGDKIGHTFSGVPYVLVNSSESDRIPGAEFVYTTVQKGLLVKGPWAEHILVHHHHRVDADFFDQDRGEAIHGLGIRSDLFWINWIRLEWQSRISDFVDRVGLGLTLWYYEMGNPESYSKVKQAAEEQSGKMNLLIPCSPGQKPGTGSGVQRIETPATGAELLNRIIEPLRKDIERYVVGQEASSKSSGSQGLGNQAGAEFQESTKFNITQFDAWLLADTITGCSRAPGVLSIMKRWSFPDADFPVNFIFGAEKPQAEKKLDGAKTIYDMKIPLKADEVRAAGGFSKPGPGDETVQAPPDQPAGGEGGAPGGLRPGGEAAGVMERAEARDKLAEGTKPQEQEQQQPGQPQQPAKPMPPKAQAPPQQRQTDGAAQYFDPNEPRAADGTWIERKNKQDRREERRDYRTKRKLPNKMTAKLWSRVLDLPLYADTEPLIDAANAATDAEGDPTPKQRKALQDVRTAAFEAMRKMQQNGPDEEATAEDHKANLKTVRDMALLAHKADKRLAALEDHPGRPKEDYQRADEPSQYFDERQTRDESGRWSKGSGKGKGGSADQPTNREPAPHAEAPTIPPTRPTGGAVRPQHQSLTQHAPQPSTANRSPLHETMERAKLKRADVLQGGANATSLLTLEDGTKAVFKTPSGEHRDAGRTGVPHGTQYRREIAVSRVADALGFGDLVPPTTVREQGGEVGSVQAFVADADKTTEVDEPFDGGEDAARAAVLDYIVGHLDRHKGNWLLKNGKLTLIDNGLSLPTAYHENDFFNMEFWKHVQQEDLPMPDVSGLADKWSAVEKELRDSGIEDEAIALAKTRFDAVLGGKEYVAELPSLLGDSGGPTLGDMAQYYDWHARKDRHNALVAERERVFLEERKRARELRRAAAEELRQEGSK